VLKLEASSAGSNGTDELDACGAADCPWYNITSIAQRPSNSTVQCIQFITAVIH